LEFDSLYLDSNLDLLTVANSKDGDDFALGASFNLKKISKTFKINILRSLFT